MIAFDASASSIVSPGASPLAFNQTCAGSNLILFLSVVVERLTDDITAVTYNGVAMTLLDKTNAAGNEYTYLYYLINPTTGTHQISIAWSGGDATVRGMSSSYTGVLQAGQPDSSNKTTGVGVTSFAVATTVVASNCWLVGVLDASGDSITAGAGTIIRELPSDFRAFCDSNGVVGTGSQSLAINCALSTTQGIVASISPAPLVITGGAFLNNFV